MFNPNCYVRHNRPDPGVKLLKQARPFLVVVDDDDSARSRASPHRHAGPAGNENSAIEDGFIVML
jgi:hypothetical protein